MRFNIEPYEVKATADNLYFTVTTGDNAAVVTYALMNGDTVVKRGELPISLQDLAIISKNPIDKAELNTFLASHGIIVTSQIIQDAEV